jgi:uncharacterized protein YjbJ (UPF0337 family)
MEWNQIEGRWKEVKGHIKKQWGKLTDDDFIEIAGKKDELVGRLQQKYGYTRERAEREIEKFGRNLKM